VWLATSIGGRGFWYRTRSAQEFINRPISVPSKAPKITSDGKCASTRVSASYHDSLIVELAVILLAGHLRIDYGEPGNLVKSAVIDFNTVMIDYYREAIDLILNGIEETTNENATSVPNEKWFRDWPMKFRSAVINYLPRGSQLLDALYWSAVIGGF
jgi:hypothetical protein